MLKLLHITLQVFLKHTAPSAPSVEPVRLVIRVQGQMIQQEMHEVRPAAEIVHDAVNLGGF